MRLCVSTIAWPREADAAVAGLLVEEGVTAIEIAPSKIHPDPANTPAEVTSDYRSFWSDRGIDIVAAQAILFGRPDLTIFTDTATRRKTTDYLKRVIGLCAGLGAGAIVFGAPRNRRIENKAPATARDIAVAFFRDLGQTASDTGTTLVLEANPPEYGADYITRAADAIDLVRAVDHSGFRLHLDTACMTLVGDPIVEVFSAGGPWLRHFHVSEPQLAPVNPGGLDSAPFATGLDMARYRHWVSIEMNQTTPFGVDAIRTAIRWIKVAYASVFDEGPVAERAHGDESQPQWQI